MADENSALLHSNTLHFKIYSDRKQLFENVIFFTILLWLLFFVLIKAVFLSVKYFIEKYLTILSTPKSVNGSALCCLTINGD